MTEREKMLAGEVYDAYHDPTLLEDRNRCLELCYDFNACRPGDSAGQLSILRQLLGHMGSDTLILAPFYCDYGYNISVGEGFFANHGLVILDEAPVRFGNKVFVGPNCGFHTAGHPLERELRDRAYEYARPITVGDSCWFGAGVQVLPGVTIGDNVVIGAGSVVTRDIPSNSVAVGNPCRVIRTLPEE